MEINLCSNEKKLPINESFKCYILNIFNLFLNCYFVKIKEVNFVFKSEKD